LTDKKHLEKLFFGNAKKGSIPHISLTTLKLPSEEKIAKYPIEIMDQSKHKLEKRNIKDEIFNRSSKTYQNKAL
jgi:hypothetical protein